MLTIAEKVVARQPKITVDELKVDLMGILSTQSITNDTEDMMEVILDELEKIKNIKVERDDYGNLYVTKGKPGAGVTFPAFVCHTDTVHKIRDNFKVVRDDSGFYYAVSTDGGEFQQVGVGGDDKCGIIVCIELLHRLKTIKCAFFLDEEQGCKGSAAGSLEFFEDCRYAIQIDRRNGGDIITTGSGTKLASPEFEKLLNELGAVYQYKTTTGLNTDVVKLKQRGLGIAACNLSAGYYNPHTKQEYINERELLNCLEFCIALGRIKTVYEHKHVPYTAPASSYGNYGNSSYWDRNSPGRYGYTKGGAAPAKPVEKKCLDCQITLNAGEGVMCTKCMRKNLHLQVYGDFKRLVIELPESSLETSEDVIPSVPRASTVCRLCHSDMISSEECDRGVCTECAKCRRCNTLLETDVELDDSVCALCLDDQPLMCKNKTCSSMLTDVQYIKAGFCELCMPFPMTRVRDEDDLEGFEPVCTACSDKLEYREEIAWNVCFECMRGMN